MVVCILHKFCSVSFVPRWARKREGYEYGRHSRSKTTELPPLRAVHVCWPSSGRVRRPVCRGRSAGLEGTADQPNFSTAETGSNDMPFLSRKVEDALWVCWKAHVEQDVFLSTFPIISSMLQVHLSYLGAVVITAPSSSWLIKVRSRFGQTDNQRQPPRTASRLEAKLMCSKKSFGSGYQLVFGNWRGTGTVELILFRENY